MKELMAGIDLHSNNIMVGIVDRPNHYDVIVIDELMDESGVNQAVTGWIFVSPLLRHEFWWWRNDFLPSAVPPVQTSCARIFLMVH